MLYLQISFTGGTCGVLGLSQMNSKFFLKDLPKRRPCPVENSWHQRDLAGKRSAPGKQVRESRGLRVFGH